MFCRYSWKDMRVGGQTIRAEVTEFMSSERVGAWQLRIEIKNEWILNVNFNNIEHSESIVDSTAELLQRLFDIRTGRRIAGNDIGDCARLIGCFGTFSIDIVNKLYVSALPCNPKFDTNIIVASCIND